MKRYLVCLVLMLSFAMSGQAQVLDTRLTDLVARPTRRSQKSPVKVTIPEGVDLQEVQQQMKIYLNDDGTLKGFSVLARLKRKAADPTPQLEQLGITVVKRIGRMLLLDVPVEKLYELENVKGIERASADGVCQLTNDRARLATQVTGLNGENPELFTNSSIPAAVSEQYPYYSGRGVLAGVVDQGIDFNHAAFRDSEGNTRLKKAYVVEEGQVVSYGPADIPTLTTDYTKETHGTHTSSTVAGSQITVSCRGANDTYYDVDLRGMAPDADLLLCGLQRLYNSYIFLAVSDFMDYADAHNQPIVVNLSIGNSGGFYDGSDELCENLTALTEGGTHPGRVVVVSAGNAAGDKSSIAKRITSAEGDQLKTILYTQDSKNMLNGYVPCYSKPSLYFYLRDKGTFEVEYKAVNRTTGAIYNLATSETYDEATERPLYNDKGSVVVPPVTLSQSGGKNYYQWKSSDSFYFKEPDIYLAIFIKGAAEGSEVVMINESSNHYFVCFDIEGFTTGSGDMSISLLATSNGVLSVGAYTTRNQYYAYKDGSYQDYTQYNEEGAITWFSSYGTDDNGYDRPDVIAPGSMILSAFSWYDETSVNKGELNGVYDTDVAGKVTLHGRDQYYGALQGTSMSTPCVAGIIALWLQANPNLSVNDVRRILRLTADRDEFVTDLNKIDSEDFRQVGVGKINALKGMQLITSEANNTITLSDVAANTDLLSANEGKTVSVTLAGRRLYRDGSWNTLCLPFDVNIAESPLEGYGMKVMTLDPSATFYEDGTLTLNFVAPADNKLLAGIPYIIKWDCPLDYVGKEDQYDIQSPTFRFVTIDGSTPSTVAAEDVVSFVGTYVPVSIDGGDASKLYLAANNTLYWPSTDMYINSHRAYFQLNDALINNPSDEAKLRSVVLNLHDDDEDEDEEVTTIEALGADAATLLRLTDEWYTLSGTRLSGRPAQKGLYLQRGRKVYVQ